MPSTVINGQTFHFTMEEFSQYVGNPVALKRTEAAISVKPVEVDPIETLTATTQNQARRNSAAGNSDKVIQRCEEHQGKRGRIGNCSNCVRENSADEAVTVEIAEEKPEKSPEQVQESPRRGGGRKNHSNFEEWLEEHGDEDMRPKMEKSIRWMLKDRAVSEKGIAHIERALAQKPRMNCREAHGFITKLHALPKRGA